MYDEIMEAKKEFENKNYEKVLEILDGIEGDAENIKFAIILRVASLRFLQRHDEALNVIDSAIEKYPYEEFLWSSKVEIHYFNNQKDKAIESLGQFERIIDKKDKRALVEIAGKFDLVGDYENALKYCDMALDIDENFIEAVRQKALTAVSLKDHKMESECADKLLEIEGKSMINSMIPFMLKLFARRYKDALDIIESTEDFTDEHKELMIGSIYNRMSEDLKIEIRTSAPIDLVINDALSLLFGYYYDDIVSGDIHGVRYFIQKIK